MENLFCVLFGVVVFGLGVYAMGVFGWKTLSSLGIFAFLVFVYVGTIAFAAGYHPFISNGMPFEFSADTLAKAFWISTVGFLAYCVGIFFVKPRMGTPRNEPDMEINVAVVLIFFVIYAAAFAVIPDHNFFAILHSLRKLNPTDLFTEREEKNPNFIATFICYPALSGCSLYLLAAFLDGNKKLLLPVLVAVALSAEAKFVYLQKQPFMIYFIQLAIVYWLTRGITFRKLLIAGSTGFSALLGMYVLVLKHHAFNSKFAGIAAAVTSEQIFFRAARPVLFAAKFIPDVLPHPGFGYFGPIAYFFGLPFNNVAQRLFFMISTKKYGSFAFGNAMALYIAFDWDGLIIGAVLTGMFLRYVDLSLVNLKKSAYAATVANLFIIPYYLVDSNLLGALGSWGGMAALLHILVFTRRQSPKQDVHDAGPDKIPDRLDEIGTMPVSAQ